MRMESSGGGQAGDAGAVSAEYLAVIAHRLRTPLTAIMGFADLLEDVEDPATILEYVRIIRSNAETLNDMMTELLERPAAELPPTE